MFKKIFFAIVFQGSVMLFAQEGVLKIEVTDSTNGEKLELVTVSVESAGVTAGTGMTDSKGNLVFKNLSPGKYDVKTIYTGYSKNMITGVLIKNNETTYLNIDLSSENILTDFVITEYKKPLVDPITSVKTIFTSDDIAASPYTNVNDFMGSVAGAVQMREGVTPNFRGSRSESAVYIIDGQPVPASYGFPMGAIQQMSVTLGGVPAKYGDGTGAFIEIETKSGLVHP